MIELTPEVILESRAEAYARKAHGNQKYGDKPYAYHLSMVVENVKLRKKGDPLLSTYVAIAWLHDVIEDCGVTYEELEREFGVCIADAVRRLTKTKDTTYEAYMEGCIFSNMAREVKICDTMANLLESFASSGSTNPALKAKGEKGMKKYPRQLFILTEGVV